MAGERLAQGVTTKETLRMLKKGQNAETELAKPARRRQGRPTLLDLEQRKSRILDIATNLFIEQGYAETSLVEIAKQAGVATRTIYQHFGDKEQIFQIVIDKRAAESEHELPTIDAEQKLFDVLTSTANYICSAALSESAIGLQRLLIAESQRFPELMRQMFESLFHRLHQNVEATFMQLAATGKTPAINHTESAKYFIDLLLGSTPLQLNMNWIKLGPSEHETRDKVALFIIGRFGMEPESGSHALRHVGTSQEAPPQ